MAVKNLKRYRRQRLKFFTAFANRAYKNYFKNHTKLCSLTIFEAPSATARKNFNRCRQQCLTFLLLSAKAFKILSDVGDGNKNFKHCRRQQLKK
jgi:hypothetical protein